MSPFGHRFVLSRNRNFFACCSKIHTGLEMVMLSINSLQLWVISTSACKPSCTATATGNSDDLPHFIFSLQHAVAGANIPMNYSCQIIASLRAPERKQALALCNVYGAEALGEERVVLGLVSSIGPRKGIVFHTELCSSL